MGAILRRSDKLWTPGQIKPGGLPKIDWSHPLAKNLISYFFDTGNGYYIDLAAGGYGSPAPGGVATQPPVDTGLYGTGNIYVAGQQGIVASQDFPIQSWAHPYSFCTGWFQKVAPSVFHSNVFATIQDSADNINPICLFNNITTGTLDASMGDFSNPTAPLGAIPVGSFNTFVGSTTGTNSQVFFWNGAQVATTTAVSAVSVASGSRVSLNNNFNWAGSTNNFCGAQIFFNAVWMRQLTQQEALQLFLDPYCFLTPGDSPVIVPDSLLLMPQIWM